VQLERRLPEQKKIAECDARAYSIYRPNQDDVGDVVEEAKKILWWRI